MAKEFGREVVSSDRSKKPRSVDDTIQLEKTGSHNVGQVEDFDISRLGLEPQTTRDMGILAVIAMGWNICNSWAAAAATLAISIASGGPVTLLYGIVLIFVLGEACALSMAEIASVYPTSGGQYHYTSILAPKRLSRALSYCCGSLNVFGWITLAAGCAITIPQMITALVTYLDPTYVSQRWHMFLMYQAVNVAFTGYNILLIKRTAWIYDVGFVVSIAGILVITVTCLARAQPKQPNEFVWSTFINTTGWPSDGIAFLTGLVNANFIYSGLDGAIHIAEECTNAAMAVPWALISTVTIGFVTAFAFAVAMTYSYNDFDAVLASPLPVFEVWLQAVSSPAAAIIFLFILLVCACFAVIGILQTASRLLWCFARDDALVGSHRLSRIHPKLGVPVWALLVNCALVFILGCVYLGSTSAFNALLGTGLILQQLSFGIPAALILGYRFGGQRAVDKILSPHGQKGRFRLPSAVGFVANALTIVHGLVALVFYTLPVQLPVTASNMNYACAVLGIAALFTFGNWIWYASKRYHGPRLDDRDSVLL